MLRRMKFGQKRLLEFAPFPIVGELDKNDFCIFIEISFLKFFEKFKIFRKLLRRSRNLFLLFTALNMVCSASAGKGDGCGEGWFVDRNEHIRAVAESIFCDEIGIRVGSGRGWFQWFGMRR